MRSLLKTFLSNGTGNIGRTLGSPLILALCGGILMGLTTAPMSAWPLAWVALAPLWFLVVKSQLLKVRKTPLTKEDTEKERRGDRESRQCFPVSSIWLPFLTEGHESPTQKAPRVPVSPRPPLLFALAWGFGYHGLALFWITGVHPMTWMGVPWLASLAIALFCWLFITFWGAALVAIWASCLFWVNRKAKLSPAMRVLIGTALWCGLEAVWSNGSLWWSSLSYTQSPHNLLILHLGQISGPLMVTAAIVAVNGLIAEAWINYKEAKAQVGGQGRKRVNILPHFLVIPNFRYLSIAAGLILGLHLIGLGLYSRPLIQPPATALKVGIIQGNIPNEIKLYPGGWRRAIEGYTSGYRALAEQKVNAVLTPETALPFTVDELRRGSFYSAVLEKGVLAWVGGFGEQGRSITNSLFTLTGTGEFVSRYDKVKLVPLGEYIPFEQFLGSFIDRLSPLDAHLIAGSRSQVFDTPFGRAIVGICYESAFAEHFRRQAALGGQFILTASNNAHYSRTMPAQHHAQDVMRAIESDRWAVRATNTGYSGIVDPHGRTRWLSGLNTYEIHAATIYRRQTQTLYVRWGDWLTPGLLILATIVWFLGRRY